jgi:hypothetical protein
MMKAFFGKLNKQCVNLVSSVTVESNDPRKMRNFRINAMIQAGFVYQHIRSACPEHDRDQTEVHVFIALVQI